VRLCFLKLKDKRIGTFLFQTLMHTVEEYSQLFSLSCQIYVRRRGGHDDDYINTKRIY